MKSVNIMKKETIICVALLLICAMRTQAQPAMYICAGQRADAFSLSYIDKVSLAPDSFVVERWFKYVPQEIDSIVFKAPAMPVEEMGWWGNMANGNSVYHVEWKAHNGQPHHHIRFYVETQDGICQTVSCELTFDSEEDAETYGIGDETEVPTDDPYIYVKETQTGPRRYEVWIMDGPLLPEDHWWQREGCNLWSDVSDVLSGRPIDEVVTIVETWIWQPVRCVVLNS